MKITKENNFDLIRLFAALQVVITHGSTHLKLKSTVPLDILTYFPGVPIFFTISGFLLYRSYEKNPNFLSYTRNRLLRIYPALWTCLIATCILLIGFGFIKWSTILDKTFWAWIITQVSFLQFYTPDSFRGFGVGSPNGSLWTIGVEISFYVFIPLVFLFIKHKSLTIKNIIIIALIIASYSVNHYLYSMENSGMLVFKLSSVTLVPFLFFFLFGTLTYLNINKFHRLYEGKGLYWLLFYGSYCLAAKSFVNGFAMGHFPDTTGLIGVFILCQTIISLAFTAKPLSGRLLKHQDISYGTYLYHMLVFNVLVELNYIGKVTYLILGIAATLILAALSWVFIEKPALNRKQIMVSRGANPKKARGMYEFTD